MIDELDDAWHRRARARAGARLRRPTTRWVEPGQVPWHHPKGYVAQLNAFNVLLRKPKPLLECVESIQDQAVAWPSVTARLPRQPHVGDEVVLVHTRGTRTIRQSARVEAVGPATLSLRPSAALVQSPQRVGVVWAGRLFDLAVVRSSADEVVIERPSALEVGDDRAVNRTDTSVPGTVVFVDGKTGSVEVVDVSTRGAGFLMSGDREIHIGDEGVLAIGDDRLPFVVRRALQTDDANRTRLGVQFHRLDSETRTRLLRTIGSARAGLHEWRDGAGHRQDTSD